MSSACDCLADISSWTAAHHLKLNLSKTELLFIPGKDCPRMDLSFTVEDVTVSPLSMARNLGVLLDSRLSCAPNITTVAQSCRFALYNIRRILSFLTNDATQLLVISRLVNCNSLLAGLPASVTKPLQHIQNTAAHLVYNLPKFSHVTPLLHDLHWLSVAARIRSKTMVLAFKAVNKTAPIYLQTLVRPHTPARALCSTTSAGWLVPPSLRANKARSVKSRLFSSLAPQWWNELPTNVRTAESLSIFRIRLKTCLFRIHLDTHSLTPSQPISDIKKKCMHLYVRIVSTSIVALMHLKNV
ncbi:uncharacterized protein LOC115588717 [Sparus aurata]|uniref:uncharacterized protein LOC115588717 n=1 Tax=Sparus aurata TaxID=8175 RepID=UPI0011C11180|nr:uncharacterized protein LOC115588717 [Sparus aurata]